MVPGRADGGPPPANLAMARACGAQVTYTGQPRERMDDVIADHASRLGRDGRSALAVPRGGASAVGALGYAEASAELVGQLAERDVDEARIVIAVGSGGSVSGLLAGLAALRLTWPVTGVSVSRPLAGLAVHVADLAARCARLVGTHEPGGSLLDLVATRGEPHGAPHPDELECAVTALRTEGLVLDSDYTARAALVAAELCRTPGPPVVLWHTGGLVRAVTDYAAGVVPGSGA
jgi:D-cysteine desulfhydrase